MHLQQRSMFQRSTQCGMQSGVTGNVASLRGISIQQRFQRNQACVDAHIGLIIASESDRTMCSNAGIHGLRSQVERSQVLLNISLQLRPRIVCS